MAFINQPTSNVTVAIQLSDENLASLSHHSLIFTPENFNVPQEVVVAGGESFGSFEVNFLTTSNDPVYHELSEK